MPVVINEFEVVDTPPPPAGEGRGLAAARTATDAPG